MHDVIIAGGGPVGLYSAKLCGKMGLDYVVLEEHGKIGRPNHCSGLVSKNLDRFVAMDKGFIEHEARGCILHSRRNSVRLTKPKTTAYIINREKFDRHLSRGVNIRFNTRVLGFSTGKDSITIRTDNGELSSRILLACDGSNSVIRKGLGLRPREVLTGLIAITRERDHDDHVELWFNSKARDGFFWKIPRGKTTEYGLLGGTVNFGQIEDFFKISEYERSGGQTPLGPIRSYSDRILLIGDAACQSKPWSGGGVVYGLTCAQIAAKTMKRAFEKNDFSSGFLSSYEREWKRKTGRQIRLGMLYRAIYRRTSESQVDLALSLMKRMKFLNKLDMDLL